MKSISGPSGRVSGSQFIFDETRNRFVFPQDKSLVVYFEWTAPPGVHVLSALWKGPDGRTASMSPDVKLESTGQDLHSYWTFEINPSDASGFWSLEIRVDGEPAGSHTFELVVPQAPKPAALPAHPSEDEIYKSSSHSLVWVHALDDTGRRLDSSLGFVNASNSVATSFQAIDGAARLEIAFPDGNRARTDIITSCSRLQDWALVKVDTGTTPPLPAADSFEPKVGEYFHTFTVEAGDTRVMAKVAITGQRSPEPLPGVTLFNPNLSPESSGAPALDEDGRVFGILGGSLAPGSRFHSSETTSNAALWSSQSPINAVVPIGALNSTQSSGTLKDLLATGVLTPPLVANPTLVWGGTTDAVSKSADLMRRTVTEFSRKQTPAWVVTLWQRKGKSNKAVLSGALYDASNRKRAGIAPKKFSFGDSPISVAFPFEPANLAPGVYRIDVLADDQVAYRTFITVRE